MGVDLPISQSRLDGEVSESLSLIRRTRAASADLIPSVRLTAGQAMKWPRKDLEARQTSIIADSWISRDAVNESCHFLCVSVDPLIKGSHVPFSESSHLYDRRTERSRSFWQEGTDRRIILPPCDRGPGWIQHPHLSCCSCWSEIVHWPLLSFPKERALNPIPPWLFLPSAALRRERGKEGNDSTVLLSLSTTVITQLLPSSLPATLPCATSSPEGRAK